MSRKVSLARLREEVKALADEAARRRAAAEGRNKLHKFSAWVQHTHAGQRWLKEERYDKLPPGPEVVARGSSEHLLSLAAELFGDDLTPEARRRLGLDRTESPQDGPAAADGPAVTPEAVDAAAGLTGDATGNRPAEQLPAATAGSPPVAPVPAAPEPVGQVGSGAYGYDPRQVWAEAARVVARHPEREAPPASRFRFMGLPDAPPRW
jgi:hypothetical protein